MSESQFFLFNQQFEDLFLRAKSAFDDNIPERDHEFVESRTWYKNHSSENIKWIIAEAARIFQDNKFEIIPERWHIDFHRYTLNGEEDIRVLGEHVDDFGAMECNVNTMILYFRKDPELKGGNIILVDDQTIFIGENSLILMRGDIKHIPEKVSGYGVRESMVIQIERKI